MHVDHFFISNVLGTLSFSVNGKDMGIAVDKLKGPLYPAFSLYNEDDQLFLSPPRQVGVDAGDEERGTGWGTSGAERAIQRFVNCFPVIYFDYMTIV